MGDNFAKLAKEIHKRDNKSSIGPCIGTITSAEEPIVVTICDGSVILEQGYNAYVCQALVDRTYQATIDGAEKTIELKDVLQTGDEVLCVPCEGEQTWLLIDKVVS